MLKQGDSGPEVVALQKQLNAQGASPALAEDGDFGPATTQAVMEFQKNNGLISDGVVGPLTESALNGPAPAPKPVSIYTAGCDVSAFQQNIDWNEVKAGGYLFAFIKASEGVSVVDQYFQANWVNAKAAGVLRGAYHFFRASVDGVKQAEMFLSLMPRDYDLPPVLDLEVTDGQDAQTVIDGALAWLDAVEASIGRKPIIYTGLGFEEKIGNPPQLAAYPLWCAQYDGQASPSIVPPWNSWQFWQWTDGDYIPNTIPGIGPCDSDWFNGSLAELQAFCKG